MSRDVRAETETVLVAGAGLAGGLIAVYLARAGHRVRVYERSPDPRERTGGAGRSINLALSTRGLHALAGVGLEQEILASAVPMCGRMIHGLDGGLTFQPYGTEAGQAINSVSRFGLSATLLEAARREPNVELVFDRKCVGVDLDGPTLFVEHTRTGERTEVHGERLIGADGAYSAVRAQMQRHLDRFDYAQSFLEHGYKELTIPAGSGGEFRLDPHALHIWPRGGFMMIALPNRDGSFTCTLFWPFSGPNGFEQLRTPDDVRHRFERDFPDAVPLMPTLVEDYFANPIGSLVTVRCRPWRHADRVVLLGDACHAVVPFYGQGANAAFEDCTVLAESIRRWAPDWAEALRQYEQRRKIHVDALADLAVENFLEMRDHVASRRFLLRKRAEKRLHRLFPSRFVPLYSMVTFSRVPYADARARARRQWAIVRRAAAGLALLLVMAVVLVLLLTLR